MGDGANKQSPDGRHPEVGGRRNVRCGCGVVCGAPASVASGGDGVALGGEGQGGWHLRRQ